MEDALPELQKRFCEVWNDVVEFHRRQSGDSIESYNRRSTSREVLAFMRDLFVSLHPELTPPALSPRGSYRFADYHSASLHAQTPRAIPRGCNARILMIASHTHRLTILLRSSSTSPHRHPMKVLPTPTLQRALKLRPPQTPLHRPRAKPLLHSRSVPPHQVLVYPWWMRQLHPMRQAIPQSRHVRPHLSCIHGPACRGWCASRTL
ncbi:hypothetical protein BC834DRAFT_898600, partial [Gloeopeniophorella convolvens]